MVAIEELSQASPATICHPNPPDGPNLLSFFVGKHHVN